MREQSAGSPYFSRLTIKATPEGTAALANDFVRAVRSWICAYECEQMDSGAWPIPPLPPAIQDVLKALRPAHGAPVETMMLTDEQAKAKMKQMLDSQAKRFMAQDNVARMGRNLAEQFANHGRNHEMQGVLAVVHAAEPGGSGVKAIRTTWPQVRLDLESAVLQLRSSNSTPVVPLNQAIDAMAGNGYKQAAKNGKRRGNPVEIMLGEEGGEILRIVCSGESANEKMKKIYKVDRRFLGYSSEKWADLLHISAAAVRKTHFWKYERPRLIGGPSPRTVNYRSRH